MNDRKDADYIPERWTFEDDKVASIFDRHVREQLPWYDLATTAVSQIARHYIGHGGLVYDIGASTGNVGNAIRPTLEERGAQLVAIEGAHEMADRYVGPGRLEIARAETFDYEPFDLAVCFLVLIFMRPDEARALLQRLRSRIVYGGAIIVVERMLPPDSYMSIVSSRLTLAAKLEGGVSPAEIIAKEISLSGVQRPLSRDVLTDLGAVEWFRYGDFAGWVIEGVA